MSTAVAWRAGVATDPGLQRAINEDRVLVHDALDMFLVVDGLGGHAAGEMAAETAVRAISGYMESSALAGKLDVEENIRGAIAEANNQIYLLAQQNEAWRGMACVLTLAVIHDEQVTFGHVGDSRLYLLWNGNLRKLTSDHSPVGEQEDQGELTEEQAMQHPRRNEVFRDVGSEPHDAHDPQFIETRTFRFRQDAALLLCSDGLSDLLTSTVIGAIVERYNGDPDSTAQQLIEAANAAGGKDNISVVFVAGADFLGTNSISLDQARPRHATTRMREPVKRWKAVLRNALVLVAGMILGVLLWIALERFIPHWPAAAPPSANHPPEPNPASEPNHSAGNPGEPATAPATK